MGYPKNRWVEVNGTGVLFTSRSQAYPRAWDHPPVNGTLGGVIDGRGLVCVRFRFGSCELVATRRLLAAAASPKRFRAQGAGAVQRAPVKAISIQGKLRGKSRYARRYRVVATACCRVPVAGWNALWVIPSEVG